MSDAPFKSDDQDRYFADEHPVTGWRVIDRRNGDIVQAAPFGQEYAEDIAGYLNEAERAATRLERESD